MRATGEPLDAMDAHEGKILFSTSLAHYATHFFILIYPALVMPISRDLAIPPEQVIALSFFMYLCYGVLAIPWGFLSDRYNPRLVMGAGLLMAGAGFIAAGQVQSPGRLIVYLGLVGAGCSAYHPSGLALLSKGVRQRGRALGINGLFGNLGIASAPLIAGLLCYLTGWARTLVVLGIFALAAGFLILALPFTVARDRDRQQGVPVDRQQAAGLFILLCCAMLFSGLMYRGFTVVLPTFLEFKLAGVLARALERLPDLARGTALYDNGRTLIAAAVTSAVYCIGMAGQILGGYCADRTELRWAYFFFFAGALPFLILLGFAANGLLVLSAGCFAFFSLGMQPIENSLIAMLTPPRWRSLSYGIKFSVVFGAGSFSVYLVSLVQGRYGLGHVVGLLTASLAMVLFFSMLLILRSRGQQIRHAKEPEV